MENQRLFIILAVAAFILVLPLIAMQLTNEVDWTATDFLIMGILLFGTGLAIELVLRKVNSTTNRLIVCAIILGAFFLIWAELAVGVFGTPFAGS